MNGSLVKKVARAWASIDGKPYGNKEADEKGYTEGYDADAEELLLRAGVATLAYAKGYGDAEEEISQTYLSSQCEYYREKLQQRTDQVAELEAKLAKAVEALEAYADGGWLYDYPGGVLYASGADTPEFKTHLDYGDKARTTLAELKGEK